ncbi:MAG TPA: phosphorylase [Terriglobales bacterium]|nr:phosphorylase [Terriglobales bacterium]
MPSAVELSGKIAIVAALHREVSGLVKNWKATSEQGLSFFENGRMVLVCGGIGAQAARRATEAIVGFCKPELIVSVGFAGALVAELRVGDVLIPRWVVDAKDGSRHDTGTGEGTVLTIHDVAGAERKTKLAEAYGAQAVDMEAAAVAQGAEKHGVRFLAIKVISDELDFAMPPMDRFVDGEGQFKTGSFAFYAAFRPWLWKSVMELGRNSSVASQVLRNTLEQESIFGTAASNRSNS